MNKKTSGLQFYTANSAAALSAKKRKLLVFACVCAIFAAAVLLFALPSARGGFLQLCNRIFAASEEINAYAYRYFDVPQAASLQLALAFVAFIVAALGLLAFLLKSRLIIFIFALLAALVQVYFGISFPPWLNVSLYAFLAAMLVKRGARTFGGVAVYIACILAVVLGVNLFSPGVNIPTETASEAVRDRLAVAELELSSAVSDFSSEIQKARRESRLRTEHWGEEPDSLHLGGEYRHEQENESIISLPKHINYIKAFAMLLLSAVLLILPFLPFVLTDARRKKALARRARFNSDDKKEAIRAMFLHLIGYLESCGKGGGNRPFSAWESDLSAGISESYAESYKSAVSLWQEAAYSKHAMSSEQLKSMREILDETESLLYDGADLKARLRMKYIECLHE